MGCCFSIFPIVSSDNDNSDQQVGRCLTTSRSNTNPSTVKSGLVADLASSVEESPTGQVLQSPNLRVFSLAELKTATKSFRMDYLLGQGGFGKVYKACVDERNLAPAKDDTGIIIAVKKLNSESVQGFDEWKAEVNFLGRLSHPNLVKLLGYCLENNEHLLVYEFMSKGSLDNHIFRRNSSVSSLCWDLRIKIAMEAARGLVFLHNSNPRIIYRDFKTSNILLDSNFNAKLSDFGLAKNGPIGENTHISTRIMGTYGYVAPEYFSTGRLYVKSDVYGFGVVLLEIITGRRAHDLKRQYMHENLVEWAKPMLSDKKKICNLLDPKLVNQYAPKATYLAAHIVLECISSDHNKRPSMEQVLRCLEDIDLLKNNSCIQNTVDDNHYEKFKV